MTDETASRAALQQLEDSVKPFMKLAWRRTAAEVRDVAGMQSFRIPLGRSLAAPQRAVLCSRFKQLVQARGGEFALCSQRAPELEPDESGSALVFWLIRKQAQEQAPGARPLATP